MKEKIVAILEDWLQLENRMENEIAFIELSVVIFHKTSIHSLLNKNTCLILGPETGKRDGLTQQNPLFAQDLQKEAQIHRL